MLQSIEQLPIAVGIGDDALLLELPHEMPEMALELSDGAGAEKVDDLPPAVGV
jgi:hypothetical protein